MKVIVLKSYLKEGLDIVERIATKSLSLPILSNILMSVGKDEARLSATDLQIGVTYWVLATTKKEGETVFPSRFLSSLLSFSFDEQVSLSLEGNTLKVLTGGYSANLKTLNPEDFPIIPSLESGGTAVHIDNDTLCKGLGQVVGIVGQSQSRPEIGGVLCVFERNEARLAATDSFRLAECRLTIENQVEQAQRFIVPAKTAKEVIAILGGRPGNILLSLSPTQIIFTYEAPENPSRVRVQIVSRLLEGEYPRYEDVIPSSHKTLLKLAKTEFGNHLRAAGIFTPKTNEVKLRFDAPTHTVSFFSQSGEIGSHESSMKGVVEGESGDIAFNWRFLQEGLLQMRGEVVQIGLNGEDGAALLHSDEEQGYRYIVMPIKN